MTVSTQLTKRIYAGNGVTRQWDVDFPFSGAADLRLFVTSPAGAEEEIKEFFSLDFPGRVLIYPTEESGRPALPGGWQLTIVRQTPLTQEVDLLRQGELDAEVLEGGYDKLTLIVQELDEKISRSIKYPVSSQVSNLETDNFLKTILDVKQEALTASSSAVSAAEEARQSAKNAQTLADSAVQSISSSCQQAQDRLAEQARKEEAVLGEYAAIAREEAQTARYYAERSIGKTVGEVYWSQSPKGEDNPGALPLFTGETIASADTLYPDFYAWLQKHPELSCPAETYEATLAEYGECPKYVLSDGSLRLPLLKNYIKMANAQEGITQGKAGLPQHTHTVVGSANYNGTSNNAFGNGTNNSATLTNIIGNAVDGSGIYGASDTVTPAHTTLYPWVCAFNAAVPVSTAVAAEFQQALSGKADVGLANVAPNLDFVVESYSDENGNWYRKYKSGWIEQGGFTYFSSSGTTITFLKAFLNDVYSITTGGYSSDIYTKSLNIYDKTSTSFKGYATTDGGTVPSTPYSWRACGQGA